MLYEFKYTSDNLNIPMSVSQGQFPALLREPEQYPKFDAASPGVPWGGVARGWRRGVQERGMEPEFRHVRPHIHLLEHQRLTRGLLRPDSRFRACFNNSSLILKFEPDSLIRAGINDSSLL